MKHLKIVHCANFSESKYGKVFYSVDRKITNGLIRNGHFVYDFSYREVARKSTFLKRKKWGASKMNERLIETVTRIRPDLLLLGHTELVETETLRILKARYPYMKIAMWWVDPFVKCGHIDERLPYLDAFFATTSPDYYAPLFKNKTSFYYMPNPCDNSIETARAFEAKRYAYDVIFIGKNDENRQCLVEFLQELKELRVGVFGNIKETLLYGQTFLDTIASSKMAINYSRYNDIPLYSSDRIIQLLAQGTLVFSPRIPEFDTLFTDDEIVYFDDFDDLRKKLHYYHEHDEERRRIAENGWRKAHEIYDSTAVTDEMLDKIFKVENERSESEPVNVICIKWGDAYDAEYINKLYSMVVRNTTHEIDFYCFTDDAEGLDSRIVVKPLPVLQTEEEKYKTIYAYRKEAGLCDDDLGGLRGKRVFFFDLDVVIISNLDELFEYPKDEGFYIIKDWNSKGDRVGQASCYSWVVGTLGYVKSYYEAHPKEVVDKYFTASQEYLSDKVIEKYGKLNFWPEDWFASFRFHCMPKFGLLRHFVMPSIPKDRPGLKVIVFHGMPNPREAILGIWKLKNNETWKRLYKVCKPTSWIRDYWY